MWFPFVSSHRSRTPTRRKPAPARLTVEALEDRAVPSAGSLDPAFGAGGLVTTDFRANESAEAGVIQPDGKVVVAGWIWNIKTGSFDFALARYHPDGSLDTSFGRRGLVTTNLGGTDAAWDVALQRDGKIVAAGESDDDFALVRYNPDGSLDRSFGTQGKVRTDFSSTDDAALGVAIQSDGKIVAAGFTGPFFAFSVDFALARYTASGQLDTTFDGDGKVTTDFGYLYGEIGAAVALYPDSDPVHGGKIVVAGTAFSDIPGNDFAVARYTTSGALDATFDGDGKATLDFSITFDTDDRARDVAVQPDGKIVIVGQAFGPFAVARLTPDGLPDPTFGTNGQVTTFERGFFLIAWSVALQDDGKIVVAGDAVGDSGRIFALARYTSVGLLDPTFGSNGKVFTSFGSIEASAADVAIQPADGKIVAVGSTVTSSGLPLDFALARYLGDDASAGLAAQTLTDSDSSPRAAASTLTPATTTFASAAVGGTVPAGSDYPTIAGTSTFHPSETAKTLTVWALGDLFEEEDETFYLDLSNVFGALLEEPWALGRILDEDL